MVAGCVSVGIQESVGSEMARMMLMVYLFWQICGDDVLEYVSTEISEGAHSLSLSCTTVSHLEKQ